ncbi:DoxX family protein [Sphingobium aquiterrae]|uniref:DoxX family protein n=1 Tax=Sphingobium aquiterrae TaxID=2038656 RepID=UPI003017D580
MSARPISSRAPRFVETVLDWRMTGLVARFALTSAYLLGGIAKLTDVPGAVAEQAHFGMPAPALFAALTIAVELIGSVLILSGRMVWLGAGMLGVFTGLAAITANAFWSMTGQARFMATNAFFEHVGLIGGFVLVAMLSRRQPTNG